MLNCFILVQATNNIVPKFDDSVRIALFWCVFCICSLILLWSCGLVVEALAELGRTAVGPEAQHYVDWVYVRMSS
jgi:hypothetical protein